MDFGRSGHPPRNEFGEIGIDDKLIARRESLGAEQIIEMNNGCICCTVSASGTAYLACERCKIPVTTKVRGDLIQGLRTEPLPDTLNPKP